MSQAGPIELEFSRKYDRKHARQYFDKHRAGPMRRLSDWREQRIARAALAMAGDPASVLDLPCGAGRFWPMLAERSERRILAADNSADMIAVAQATQAPEIVARVEAFQTSAFAIDLGDGAVDCVFSMRLLHHIAEPAHRLAMLREFHRVSCESVVLSLWVDGNFKAWRRARLEARRQVNNNRFVVPRPVIEAEFAEAGFDIVGYRDFLPGYAMWRIYTLRKRG